MYVLQGFISCSDFRESNDTIKIRFTFINIKLFTSQSSDLHQMAVSNMSIQFVVVVF